MPHYQSVIFIDLDGTLIINPFESAIWPRLTQEIADQASIPAQEVYRLIEAEYRARQQDEAFDPIQSMDWDDIASVVASRLGVSVSANCVELVHHYASTHASTLEYAHEALSALTAPHRALVVATKGLARYQQPVLDALNLTHYFTAVITPDTHNGLKKHRRFFGNWPQQAIHAIMVGDLYDDDVRYPTQHGFKTIWKPPLARIPDDLHSLQPMERARSYSYQPDQITRPTAIILSLHELPQTVALLEQTDA
ncbi:MAG: HAD family hydrolase [Anaerolineae bacterium]|nr:HAD family hydrolase [Anaerolineae bacterium]